MYPPYREPFSKSELMDHPSIYLSVYAVAVAVVVVAVVVVVVVVVT